MNYYPLSLQQQPSVSDSSSCSSTSGGGGCPWADDASRRHCHVHSRSVSWEEHTVINQQQYSLSLSLSLWLAQSPTRCYANDKDDAVQHLQLATASLSLSRRASCIRLVSSFSAFVITGRRRSTAARPARPRSVHSFLPSSPSRYGRPAPSHIDQ